MYEFALPEGAYVQEHDNTVAAVQVTETLMQEVPVKFAKRQVEQTNMVLYGYSIPTDSLWLNKWDLVIVPKGFTAPTDPKWSRQWQLVSLSNTCLSVVDIYLSLSVSLLFCADA
jgi:hypothetical protein